MKGSLIFVAIFVVVFTLATIIAPVPMFPGNMIYIWFGIPSVSYAFYISAIINGITYGLIIWIVYKLVSKRIEKPTSEELVDEEKKHAIALPNESGEIICPNPRCQRNVEEPVLLKRWSTTPAENYYACPHCFMKLDVDIENAQPQKEEEKKEKEEPPVKPLEKEGKGPSECPHHFGYLAKLPKNVPIPQECLICSNVSECMLKLYQEEAVQNTESP